MSFNHNYVHQSRLCICVKCIGACTYSMCMNYNYREIIMLWLRSDYLSWLDAIDYYLRKIILYVVMLTESFFALQSEKHIHIILLSNLRDNFTFERE